jgi:uncharacterized protein involved in oxidation of intracellular sulfur
MNVLVIINDPPYGTERAYNGMRLAISCAKQDGVQVRVFLMADAVACAKAGQRTPKGYYNLEMMIRALLGHHGEVGLCGSCMDARGIAAEEILEGAHRSSMEELTAWTLAADRVVTF